MTERDPRRPPFFRDPRLRLPLFLLRAFYLQPAANPVFPAAGAFLLFFWAEGSLDRLHLALLLYLFLPAHLRIADPFGGGRRENGAVRRLFRSLPVRPELLLRSYLAATAVYALLVWGGIALGVERLSRPPDWVGLEKIAEEGPGGERTEKWVGFARNARGVHRFAVRTIERSLLFDTASGMEGAAPLLSAFFLVSFLHLSLHRIARGSGGFSAASLRAHLLPFALYLTLGAAFLAEVALDRAETAAWVRALLAHGGALRAGIALALAGAILSSVLLLRGVRRDLRGAGR